MTTEERQEAFLAGHRAEGIAALYLRLKGFHILARRYKCPVGEIDIVARRGRLLVYVEVKARKSEAAARESISARQQARITRAATHFLKSQADHADCAQRFDAILIVPQRLPIHIPDAWR